MTYKRNKRKFQVGHNHGRTYQGKTGNGPRPQGYVGMAAACRNIKRSYFDNTGRRLTEKGGQE